VTIARAIRLKPGFSAPFDSRGVTCAVLRQYDKAIADYTEIIRLKPDEFYAHRSRADCYENLGKYSDAANDRAAAKRLTK
jgi:tetratricopeptide (TPR) repeat protein